MAELSKLPARNAVSTWVRITTGFDVQMKFVSAGVFMNAKQRLLTLGVVCFAGGFLTCYLSFPRTRLGTGLARGGTAMATAPVGIGPGVTVAAGIDNPTNFIIRGPDRWQWADGILLDSPPPNWGQRDLG